MVTADVATVAVVCADVGRYTANLGDHSISAFAIDATTAALNAIPGSPYTGPLKASYVAAEPTGRFLYALDNENGALRIAASGIDVYSIDATTGALTVVSGYTANVNAMSVSGYALDTTSGAVTSVSGSPFASGTFPFSVTTDPRGKFAYAADSLWRRIQSER